MKICHICFKEVEDNTDSFYYYFCDEFEGVNVCATLVHKTCLRHKYNILERTNSETEIEENSIRVELACEKFHYEHKHKSVDII